MSERNRASGGRLENVTGALLVRRFSVRQPDMYRVVETVSTERLSSMDKAGLCELAQTAMDLEYENLDGDFVQAGFGLGGAAIVLAHAKNRSRPLFVYDPFTGTPHNQLQAQQILSSHDADERQNTQVVSGLYAETIPTEGTLALAYLDCSDYDQMRLLLERLTPRLVPTGHLIIDDYRTQEACRKAVDEYFRGKRGFQFVRKSRLHIIKNKS